MSLTALAAALLCNAATAVPCCERPDSPLVNPAPWPANRTDSVHRLENGRIWVPRSPIGNRTPLREFNPGPARYGAAPELDGEMIYVRVGPSAIPISPWCTYGEVGLGHLREARNQWLRDEGYVLKVRTHVNPRYLRDVSGSAAPSMYSSDLPRPRATIRVIDEVPRTPSRLRVEAEDVRISRPHAMAENGPIRVLPEDAPAVAQDGSQE